VESVPCPLCGRGERRAIVAASDRLRPGSTTRYEVVRCENCGLAFTDPRPTPQEMPAFYPPSYGGREGERMLDRLEGVYRRHQQREVAHWLAAVRPRQGRVLDVGCGAGDLLAELRADGWDVRGIEPAPEAAELARRRHGLRVWNGRFEDAPPAGRFDVVTLAGVLEHLHDPLGALRKAASLLAPDGLVAVLFVPRLDSAEARRFGARWLAFDLPRHLTHFDEASFTRMAEAAGLRIVRREPYSSRHSAAQLVGSFAPGLQKHRFYLKEGGDTPTITADDESAAGRRTGGAARAARGRAATPLAPLARRAAFLALTTVARPWCRLEAARGRGAVCSYFLRPKS